MLRITGALVAMLAFLVLIGSNSVDAQVQAKKNQMVKGTIKTVDPAKDLLVVKQKVKDETVDRELSILATTEFVVTIKGEKKEAVGKAGLQLLEGREGAPVQVKCDKDVNVLKVTVTVK